MRRKLLLHIHKGIDEMSMFRKIPQAIAATALLLPGGCSRAPMMDMDGSFLPSWMFCLLAGILAAGITYWQLVRRRLQHRVMPEVIFYPSLVVAVACLLWLVFFR